ncbi:MAG: hypothetical protein WBG71_03570 [Leeuwenhoekiella sp.]
MADINIEKKKTIWPWILIGVLILLAVLYFALLADDDDVETDDITTEEVMVEEEMEEMDNTTTAMQTGAIATYSEFVGMTGDMGIDHEYSNQALLYLIEAVNEKATAQNVNIEADLGVARANANTITKDPMSVEHADLLKESFEIINRAISKIQMQSFPNLESQVTSLEEEVASIDPADQTLNQKAAVNTYFKEAADVLNKMQ